MSESYHRFLEDQGYEIITRRDGDRVEFLLEAL
jgi:hypothetical protein